MRDPTKITLAASAMAASLCVSAVLAQTPPHPPVRPTDLIAPAPAVIPSQKAEPGTTDKPSAPEVAAPAPQPEAPDACHVELTALEARFEPAEAPPASQEGCAIVTPVRLKSVRSAQGEIVFHGDPLLACAAALAAARHAKSIMAPLAKGALGATLTGVNASGFECRPRNRVAGAKLSAHGKGEALDITGFRFADGGSFEVRSPPTPRQGAWLLAIRRAACGYFTTVLGPGANASHADHLHFDVEQRGRSGTGRVCE